MFLAFEEEKKVGDKSRPFSVVKIREIQDDRTMQVENTFHSEFKKTLFMKDFCERKFNFSRIAQLAVCQFIVLKFFETLSTVSVYPTTTIIEDGLS